MFMRWLIFQVLLVVNSLQDDDEWIDPTDMLNYDAAAGRMRRPQQTSDGQDDTETLTTEDFTEDNRGKDFCPDCSSCERQLDNLQKRFDECGKKQSAESTESSCNPVFKRYLNKLLLEIGKLGLPDNNEVHYDAEIIITKQDVIEIKKFLNVKAWKAGALDDALSKLLINFKHHNHEAWKWKFEDTFGVDPSTAFLSSASLTCIVIIIRTVWTVASPFTRPFRFFLYCFLISFVWNWMFLYKTAFAKRQANFAKLQLDKPMCTGVQDMDWKGSLVEWFKRTWSLQDDPCEKYYEALLVDPVLEVPPTKALMLTITTLFTEPLKHIGQPISQFWRDLLKDLPWLLQFPVTLTIILAVIAFCYSSGHAVVRYVLNRPLRDIGPRAPVAYHNVPYGVEGPVRDTFYQRGGYVDYQAGGDAGYVPHFRRGTNHHQPDVAITGPNRPRDIDHQGVEELMNWERAGIPDDGRGDNQLRRRRVPHQQDYYCARYTSEELGPINGVVASNVPRPPEENVPFATQGVMEDDVALQAGGSVEQCEGYDLQNKAAGLAESKSDNQLHKGRRADKKDMQNNGQVLEQLETTDRPLVAVSQFPSGGSATKTEVTDKKPVQERKSKSEASSIENVGVQAFNNPESGENQRT
ncbi:chloride channel CLIC-like protein 1 [Heptranchias perlo]|uniref:chloride channel CLIC-like protein 1 n=1 Tax=Heptranchias perlo TaxID=212740 RepID=UPI003559ED9B